MSTVSVPRPMRFRWIHVVLVAAAAVIGWLVFETRSLAELAGRAEIAARAADAAAAEATARWREADAGHRAAGAAVTRLEGELTAHQGQLAAMAAAVQQAAAAAQARVEAAEAAAARALEPIPEGVRLCLHNLHDCLRAEGYSGQRFLAARALDGAGLHDVEMLDTHPDGFGVAVVQAARMVADLERDRGRLRLVFFDGFRSDRGERTALPKDGWSIVFEPIDGRLFEERLPFLVRPSGLYPETPPPGRQRRPTDLDPATRLQWLERFDRLLAAAGTQEELRVERCRGIGDGRFLDVQLIGTDSKHRLLFSADCQRLAVEVDAAAGVVSLLLEEGSLRRGGVESTILAQGYRMLLPKVTAKMATDVMLGLVVVK